MSALLGAALQVAGALIPGQRAETAADVLAVNQQGVREHGKNVRRGAAAAGFNPLTYLAALGGPAGISGGAGGQVAPLASGLAALGQNVDLFGNKTVQDGQDKMTKQAERDLKRIAVEVKNKGGAAPVVAKTAAQAGPVEPEEIFIEGTPSEKSLAEIRPLSRWQGAGPFSKGSIPMWQPDGTETTIPRKVADRLELDPFDVLLTEDKEAFYGDEGGQVVSLPRIPGAIQLIEGGLWGASEEERIEKFHGDTRAKKGPAWWLPFLQSNDSGKRSGRNKSR